jgi:hypothetical protein
MAEGSSRLMRGPGDIVGRGRQRTNAWAPSAGRRVTAARSRLRQSAVIRMLESVVASEAIVAAVARTRHPLQDLGYEPHADEPDALYAALLDRFRAVGDPVAIDFRSVMPMASAHDRATHLMHFYPAKLLRHIPALFVRAPQLSSPGAVVMDPFCGSGTVLVEGLLAGRNVVGSDANPFAAQLARVKSTPIPWSVLKPAIDRMLNRVGSASATGRKTHPRLEYWFYPRVAAQLQSILHAIAATKLNEVREFFEICLSACVRKVSLADPRVAVPVRLKADQYPPGHWLAARTKARLRELRTVDVRRVFEEVVWLNAARLRALGLAIGESEATASVSTGDVRHLSTAHGEVVDLVVTSPPYLGAQKYIRASSLSLLWLGFAPDGDLRPLIANSIGREHFRRSELENAGECGIADADEIIADVRRENPMRAHLATTYLAEMSEGISSTVDVLKPGGHIVLVAGGNTLCGRAFDTPRYLAQLALRAGLRIELELIDTIRSRGLMTRRNRAASPISQEWVFVMRKPTTSG